MYYFFFDFLLKINKVADSQSIAWYIHYYEYIEHPSTTKTYRQKRPFNRHFYRKKFKRFLYVRDHNQITINKRKIYFSSTRIALCKKFTLTNYYVYDFFSISWNEFIPFLSLAGPSPITHFKVSFGITVPLLRH